jgi:hypothetical protein
MRLGLLWALGVVSGLIGALVLFDALPGINWTIWTVLVVAGLVAYRRPDPPTLKAMALPLGFAVVLAVGASITTTPILLAAILAMVASLLALALLVAPEGNALDDYGAADILTAPLFGLGQTFGGAMAMIVDTAESSGTTRERPALRGALLAAPVVIVLALLFATADPVLGRGRQAVYEALSTFDALPRVIFGVLLTLFVAGAFYSSRRTKLRRAPWANGARTHGAIGLTERRIILGAAAAMSWIFVLLQISYLFGTTPSVAGSGVTFADYARRGFGELCVAATGVALLIVAAHQRLPAADEARARSSLMWPSLALLGAECCVLFSAFHRVSLYEGAYGYTTSRVYAQAYMIIILVVLMALAWHVLREFRVRVLARQVMTIALATLAILVFWNADAWVARENVSRYAQTGKLDVAYLGKSLSPDAYPALVEALPRLAPQERDTLALTLAKQYSSWAMLHEPSAWYEWNLRRSAARSAQAALPQVSHSGS